MRSAGLLVVALLGTAPVHAQETASILERSSLTGFELAPAYGASSELAPDPAARAGLTTLPGGTPEPAELSLFGRGRREPAPAPAKRGDGTVFSARRAAVMLRSLTVPGWGQATLGRRHAAAAFAVAEAGVWSAYAAFKIQELMRTESYVRTAKLFAGIDLRGRDEEYLRIVGGFASSDEYNLYVVARDAANLYMNDPYAPDMTSYWAYIADHSLRGRDTWSWTDFESFRRYGDQRKRAQRAALRANTVLAVAVVNRILSALHAARHASPAVKSHADAASWNVDLGPGMPGERYLFRAGVRARF